MISLFKERLSNLISRLDRRYLKQHAELWADLEDYRKLTQSTGSKWATLRVLHEEILRRKPRAILECGTGLTTVLICSVIKEIQKSDPTYAPVFHSMESEPYWFDHALKLLPAKYKSTVELHCSETVEDSYGFFRGVRYSKLPQEKYDFVFVDGPSYKVEKGAASFCFDALSVVLAGSPDVAGVIDTRVSTVYVLQQLFGVDRVAYQALRRVATFQGLSMKALGVLSDPPSQHFIASATGKLRLQFRR